MYLSIGGRSWILDLDASNHIYINISSFSSIFYPNIFNKQYIWSLLRLFNDLVIFDFSLLHFLSKKLWQWGLSPNASHAIFESFFHTSEVNPSTSLWSSILNFLTLQLHKQQKKYFPGKEETIVSITQSSSISQRFI